MMDILLISATGFAAADAGSLSTLEILMVWQAKPVDLEARVLGDELARKVAATVPQSGLV